MLGVDTKVGTADATGLWKLIFSPVAFGGGELELSVASGADNITLTGLLSGDVIFCSGQSNSETPSHNSLRTSPILPVLIC